MSGSENIYKPSADPDLGWVNRNTVLRQSAGLDNKNSERRKKETERNCAQKLGLSPENEIKNVSPNATNISHG